MSLYRHRNLVARINLKVIDVEVVISRYFRIGIGIGIRFRFVHRDITPGGARYLTFDGAAASILT